MTSIDEIVRELTGLLEKIPEGPYFAAEDEARDAPPHTNSGLAMVDAGRVSEWPAARLIEWPMARAVAALLTHGPALLSAPARGRRTEEALRRLSGAISGDLLAEGEWKAQTARAELYSAMSNASKALEDNPNA